MSKSLMALVAGLLLGVVAGVGAMAFFGGSETPPMPTTAHARDRSGATGGAADRAVVATPVEASAAMVAARTERGASSSEIPGELSEGVGELIRRAPEKLRGPGDRSIKGRVVDSRGTPLAGVLLRAVRTGDAVPSHPSTQRVGAAAPPPPTLEEAVRSAISAWYENGGEYHQVETGADGRYQMAALRDGHYQLSIWRAGFVFQSEHGHGGTQVRPDATVDWTGKQVCTRQVAVLLPDGTSAPCASIDVRKEGRDDVEASQGWFARDPTIALETGRFEVRATLGHPSSGPEWADYLVSPWVKLAVSDADATAQETQLKLESKPGVRGRVILSTGGPPPQAMVKLKQLDAGERADPASMQDGDDDGKLRTEWIGNGEFTFIDLKAGRYLLAAQRYWNAPILAHAEIVVAEQMVRQDLVMPELDVATCLVVTVRASDGTLLPQADFQWRVDSGNGSNHQDSTADRREVGTWWLPLEAAKWGDFDPLRNWPSGAHLYLVVQHEDHGSTGVEVFGATRTVDVRFGPPATLVVTVPGLANEEFEGQINFGLNRVGKGVEALGWDAGGEPNREEGMARLGPVEAGRWKLTMWMSSSRARRWNQFEAGSIELSLSPGENHATMTMPTLHRFTLRVPVGVEGPVNVEQAGKAGGRRWLYGEVDKSGAQPQVTFEDVQAGDYKVTLNNGPAPGVMHFSVPGSGTLIDWAPQPVTAIRVVFGEKSEGVASIGFVDGDLITSIDGKEVASAIDLQVLWTLARAQRPLTLVVQRAGAAVTLEVKGEDVNKHLRSGATLEPTSR
jgi:hypothetical protein